LHFSFTDSICAFKHSHLAELIVEDKSCLTNYNGDEATLFEPKKSTIICEETMGDANEYWKLLEPLTKQEKNSEGRKTYVICCQCNKLGHFKEHFH
jgi:hypothetical protein